MSSAAWQEIRVRSGRDDKVEGGVYLCFGYGGWGERQVIRDAPLAVAFGRGAQQVPPLRYAPVGMTRWRVAFTSASVTWDGERCRSFATLPVQLRAGGAHSRRSTTLRSGRDDKVESGVYLCFGYGGWGTVQVIRDTPSRS
jgi:hypothetical protein